MKPSTAYRQYHPKWYRTRVPTLWWSRKWPYLKFMLRELSSVFVAFYVVILLLQLHALRGGPETYLEFQHWLTNPLLVVLNGISFLFVLFHAVTWFNLTPKAMAVRWRGKRLPDLLVAAPSYVAWLAISGLVILLLMRQGQG
jgi:fumarate reductase subunit C